MVDKSVIHSSPHLTTTSWWGALLLGLVFIAAGLFILGDVALATVISAVIIGFALLVAGVSEVIHAFSAPHWRGFALRLLIGVLYGLCGVALIADPLAASLVLTLVFALALIVSGVMRIFQSFQYWRWAGSLLLLSGLVGTLAGFVILAKWPVSGLWVLGTLVGIDLLLHGVWWIALGLQLRREPRTAEP
ncbi:HdeD family acid-resistance protein [Hyphomicrobium sp.]|uniref:HdeD family acid-resistance protein n=1 Tax=Hyphomicrobium sp. TaxID=82 RepID=UPI002FDC9EED